MMSSYINTLCSRLRPSGLWLAGLALLASCGPSTSPYLTPEATETGVGSPSSTQAAAPVSPSPAALASRLSSEAMEWLTAFTETLSPRASTTQQERDAAEFLRNEFEAMGYRAELQPFEVDAVSSEVVALDPTTGAPREYRSLPMTLSATGTVSGILARVGRGFEEDLPAEGLNGKVALVQRGETTFQEKVATVAAAGALGAVIYNNRPGLLRGTLITQGPIPVVSVSRESGVAILQLMEDGEVEARVSVTSEPRRSQNVVAEKVGTGVDGGVVVLGGHYDTVPSVPGANDNGSGVATLVAIARQVSAKSYPFTVRFIGFGSEERGLVGSRIYVGSLSASERDAVVAMLNFDALGSGRMLGVLGDSELTSSAVEYGFDNGIAVELRPLIPADAGSDHFPFQQAGIPVLFFMNDDFSRIHTPEDRLESVGPQFMGNAAALAMGLLDTLARR